MNLMKNVMMELVCKNSGDRVHDLASRQCFAVSNSRLIDIWTKTGYPNGSICSVKNSKATVNGVSNSVSRCENSSVPRLTGLTTTKNDNDRRARAVFDFRPESPFLTDFQTCDEVTQLIHNS